MLFWYDTEFIENGRTIELLSIGMVAEDGRELYFENSDATYNDASEWVVENVLPHLWHRQPDKSVFNGWSNQVNHRGGLESHKNIAWEIKRFCDPVKFGKPELWAYYADYDHVALCQLFGTMMDLPSGWPMYTKDIKQFCDDLGNPKLPEQGKGEHNALADAKWNRRAFEYLLTEQRYYHVR